MTDRYTIKKIAALFTVIAFLIVFAGVKGPALQAADANVMIASSTTQYNEGDTIQIVVSVTGEKVSTYSITLSYSSDKLEYTGGSSNVTGGGGSLTITGTGQGHSSISFKAISTGTGTVYAATTAYDSAGKTLSTNEASAGFNITKADETTTEETTSEETTETTTEETTEEKTEEKTEDTTEETTAGEDTQDTTEAKSTESGQNPASGNARIYASDGRILIDLPARSIALSDVPDNMAVPSGYEKAILEADGVKVNAFMNSSDKNFFIIYADREGKGGNFSLCCFDKSDGSVQRYFPAAPAPAAEPEKEESEKPKFYTNIGFIIGVIFFIIGLIFLIVSFVRNRGGDDDDYYDDYDDRDFPREDRRRDDYAEEDRRRDGYAEDDRRRDDYAEDDRRRDDYAEDDRRRDDYAEEDRRRDDNYEEDRTPQGRLREADRDDYPSEERNAADKLKEMTMDDETDQDEVDEPAEGDEADRDESEEADRYDGEPDHYDEQDYDDDESDEPDKVDEPADASDKTAKPKVLASEVNPDTGEFIMEEALLNNRHINVPPIKESPDDKIKKAMAERPFGIDSAFDVVAENLVKKTDEEIARDNGIILPGKHRDYDEDE